jgi:hypothetical protein
VATSLQAAIGDLDHAPALAYLAHLSPQKPHKSLLGEAFPHSLERTRLLAHLIVLLGPPPTLQGHQRTRYSITAPRAGLYSLTFREEVFSETQLAIRRVLGSSLRVDLFLYHRFRWLSCGYRVCVTMHNLPDTVFRSKDHRNPQSEWGDLLPSVNLSL